MIRKIWKFVLAVGAIAGLGGTAHAQQVARSPVAHVSQVSVTKTSKTALAANGKRFKWCIEAAGPAVNAAPVWYTMSTSAGITRPATTTNGVLLGGTGDKRHCDEGDAGGVVYSGIVTVIGSDTSGSPVVTLTEW